MPPPAVEAARPERDYALRRCGRICNAMDVRTLLQAPAGLCGHPLSQTALRLQFSNVQSPVQPVHLKRPSKRKIRASSRTKTA